MKNPISPLSLELTMFHCIYVCVMFVVCNFLGQERYHSLAPMYYRGAQAAIVVYDITNQVSLPNI